MADLINGPSSVEVDQQHPEPPPLWQPPAPVATRSFWTRQSTWIVLTVLVVALAVGYLAWSSLGFASVAGGCGGG